MPVLGSSGKLADAVIPGGFVPAGTRMVFAQAAPPAGWTQDANYNDRVLRFVSGAGGGTGGSASVAGGAVSTSSTSEQSFGSGGPSTTVEVGSGGGTIVADENHTHETSGHSHSHSLTYSIRYRDVIAARKD